MLLLPNVDPLVEPRELADRIEAGYLADVKFLPRQALAEEGLWFAPMTALWRGRGLAVKLVGIFPGARPPVKALVVTIDPETGSPTALINGTQLTGWRTAAASAVAAKAMGASPASIGVLGAGIQARYHVLVFRAVYPDAEVRVYTPSGSARRLAEELNVKVAGSAEEALLADLVIAATSSRTPVIRGGALKDGVAVISVGAPRPVRELDEDVKRDAGCMLADNPHADEETDDLSVQWVYMGDFLRGRPCRFGRIKAYKSVGNPMFDAVAAYYVLERARRLGLGVEVAWS